MAVAGKRRGFGLNTGSNRIRRGNSIKQSGKNLQSIGMVGGLIAMSGNPVGLVVGGALVATSVYGAVKTYKGNKMVDAGERANRIDAFRAKYGKGKGAGGTGKKPNAAMKSGIKSAGKQKTASIAGSNGAVKAHVRQSSSGKIAYVKAHFRNIG